MIRKSILSAFSVATTCTLMTVSAVAATEYEVYYAATPFLIGNGTSVPYQFTTDMNALRAFAQIHAPARVPDSSCVSLSNSLINTCGWRWTGGWHSLPEEGFVNGVPVWYVVEAEIYDLSGEVWPNGIKFARTFVCPTGPYWSPPAGSWFFNSTFTCTNFHAIESKTCPDGNPIYPSDGTKRQSEIDYQGRGSNHLRVERTYRSDSPAWLNNYDVIAIDYSATASNSSPPDGQAYPFYPDGSQTNGVTSSSELHANKAGRWNATANNFGLRRGNGQHIFFGTNITEFQPPSGNSDRVSRIHDGSGATVGFYVYNSANESTEQFDISGRLQNIVFPSGQFNTLIYSDTNTPINIAPTAGKLITVQDNFGHQINFSYDSKGRRTTLTDPLGGVYSYAYDEASAINSNGVSATYDVLTSVTYPDGKRRIYWYNEQDKTANTNLPYALTGITDENGNRFATYMYDTQGHAISTEHAGGAAKVTLSNITGSSTSVIDAIGTTRVKRFTTIDNATFDAGQDQPGGSGCAASSNSITYDSNGNVASRTDFGGSVTTYAYDLTRNLQTTKIVASGTPRQATTMTSWHANFRLPTAISEPLKRTILIYDGNGNLLSKTEQATSDADGSLGFNATLVVPARIWSYTYNVLGQILTATSPRTDVLSQVTYAYDASGNMSSMSDASGHATQFNSYDANGGLLQRTDPKGVVTDIAYTPRGWVSSTTVTPPGAAARITGYTYDAAGQLIGVSQPDGSSLTYSYDAAHRLIGATDAKGNSVSYTLDNMGNRIAEQIKDLTGTLLRSINRSFDALNRLQQVSGAAQ